MIVGQVFDTSGQKRHGHPYGGVEDIGGKVGRAGKFDGSNDFVETPAFGFNCNYMTFACWIYALNLSARHTLFGQGNTSGLPHIEVGTGNGGSKRVVVMLPGVWEAETENNVIDVNGWYHIIVVKNGAATAPKIYVNLVEQTLVTSNPQTYSSTSVKKQLGQRGNSTQWFNGYMDEAYLFSSNLAAGDRERLYRGERVTTALAGEWKFEIAEHMIMTVDEIDCKWVDDSFASGWSPTNCALVRNGDIAEITVNAGQTSGHIQKTGLSIDAATYKYCVVCVKGTDRFFLEVYDGSWKSVTSGHEYAPSEYDPKVFDLSSITTGTITGVRLAVGDSEAKKAYYDFVGFYSYKPEYTVDKIIDLTVMQREAEVDEFDLIGATDIGGGITIGRYIHIWLKGAVGERAKVFAGVVEEGTPEDLSGGRVYHATGRCMGQKLLLQTKTIDLNDREVSLAVKDLVASVEGITTYQVETPSPSVYVTKDFQSEYIMDALKDLANDVGSDWEVKLGMGNDLRFRSRQSVNVPSLPYEISESSGHILRGVKKAQDGYRAYNKVSVIGGERSNIDGDPDKYTDQGDVATYVWQAFYGGVVEETAEDLYYGQRGINCYYNSYVNVMVIEFRLSTAGIDLRLFGYARFMHKGDTLPSTGVYGIQVYPGGTTFYFQLRLIDSAGRNANITYLPNSTQPPRAFAEVLCDFDDFTKDSGFDWEHVKYVQFRVVSDRTLEGEGVRGRFQIDKFNFWTPNMKKSATTTNEFRVPPCRREYIHRDDKLVNPSYVQQVANALINVIKNLENRYRVPVLGMAFVQVGHKATVTSTTHGLSGTYYVVEAEHRITRGEGYRTEMTLESPRLYLETLLAQAIQRKIKLIERGAVK